MNNVIIILLLRIVGNITKINVIVANCYFTDSQVLLQCFPLVVEPDLKLGDINNRVDHLSFSQLNWS